jgi:MFS family permease
LLADAAFMRGLCAVFFFFFANLSFYLVMTLFMQNALHIAPLQAGLVFVPLALAFVIASRHSAVRAQHRGTRVLIEGCAVQIMGLAALAAVIACVEAPTAPWLVLPLVIVGYGQGLVMAPLSGAVLSTVQAASAGSGSGMYGTTAQIANGAGVAAIGAVYFAVLSAGSARMALFASFAVCALSVMSSAMFLKWMRRAAKA